MAITVGTPVNNSNAGASTLALNLGTRSLNDVVLLAGSINQTSNEDVFTSWTKTAGTSTISAIQEIVLSQGPNMYLSVAVLRVTGGGTLTITGTLTGSRRWAATGIPMTGVPSGLSLTAIYNAMIGLDAGTGAAPATSPSVAPETIGDVAFGIGAWEGARTGTISTSPANWTERVDITIGGSGGDNADSTLYVETLTSTTLAALQSAPTISASADYRHAMVIIRGTVPTNRYTLTAAGLSLSLSGSAASLLRGRRLVGDALALNVAGDVASLLRGRLLTADGLSVALVAGAAPLLWSGRTATQLRSASNQFLYRNADLIDYNAPYCVCGWVRFDSLSGQRNIIGFSNSFDDFDLFYRNSVSGLFQIGCQIGGVDSSTGTHGTITVELDTWYFVAMVRTSTTALRSYIGPTPETIALSGDITHPSVASRPAASLLSIGALISTFDTVDGRVQAFRSFASAKDAAELALEAPFDEPYATAHSGWRLDELDYTDVTGNARDLSIINGPLSLESGLNLREAALHYTLTADGLSLTFAGGVATGFKGRTLIAEGLALSFAGGTVDLLAGHRLTVDGLSLSVANADAVLLAGRVLLADGLSLTLVGGDNDGTHEGSGLQNYTLTADGLVLSLIGGTIAMSRGIILAAEGLSLSLGVDAADLLLGRRLDAAGLSLSLAGGTVALLAGHRLSADELSLSLAGGDVSLLRGRRLSAEGLTVGLTTPASSLLAGHALSADAASFTVSVAAASLLFGRRLTVAGLEFTLAGGDVQFTHDVPGVYELDGDTCTITFVGGAALLQHGRLLIADGISLALVGGDATLLHGRRLTAEGVELTLAGSDAELEHAGQLQSYTLVADGCTLVIVVGDAGLQYAQSVTGGPTHIVPYPTGFTTLFECNNELRRLTLATLDTLVLKEPQVLSAVAWMRHLVQVHKQTLIRAGVTQ